MLLDNNRQHKLSKLAYFVVTACLVHSCFNAVLRHVHFFRFVQIVCEVPPAPGSAPGTFSVSVSVPGQGWRSLPGFSYVLNEFPSAHPTCQHAQRM